MNRKILILLACLIFFASACEKNNLGNKNDIDKGKTVEEKIGDPEISNLNDEKTLEYVTKVLADNVKKESLDKFAALVRDYNKGIPQNLLIGDFKCLSSINIDTGKIIDERSRLKHDFPDTNCRINSFLLLKDEMKFKIDTKIDDDLLFMDEEAITNSNLFTAEEFKNFKGLFSRVATKSSKDPKLQGDLMSEFLSNFSFPEKIKMLSVVLHDNLDGDYLFIGHVGVLLPLEKGYLFIEKISFEEPYQAIKFPDKESCYRYLKEKFEDYKDPNVAPPFIMENNKYVDI
uniref:DUF4300 family protein n=1 Tax=Peptoniphilus grossensis TaxID=1465756 RepID=UPI00288BF125|nr:DUF4300 family protein [Peptoniphilus grossensis]